MIDLLLAGRGDRFVLDPEFWLLVIVGDLVQADFIGKQVKRDRGLDLARMPVVVAFQQLADALPHERVGRDGIPVAVRGSPWAATIGTFIGSEASSESTVTRGATMTIPSTSWLSRSSIAAEIACGPTDARWSTVA